MQLRYFVINYLSIFNQSNGASLSPQYSVYIHTILWSCHIDFNYVDVQTYPTLDVRNVQCSL